VKYLNGLLPTLPINHVGAISKLAKGMFTLGKFMALFLVKMIGTLVT